MWWLFFLCSLGTLQWINLFSCLFFLGYDVIAQAQSGTGKTATFAISILQQIDVEMKATQALVLAPTRELAQQVGLLSQCINCGNPALKLYRSFLCLGVLCVSLID